MEYGNTASLGAAGASFGPWGAAAGAGIGLGLDLMASNAAKKQAAARAQALQKKAQARRAMGQQEADLARVQGQTNSTSEFTSMLGRGVSRNASAVGDSLSEITNRAEYAANQALASAEADAQAYLSDSADVMSNSRDAQRADQINMATSILGTGAGLYNAKYGKWGSAERNASTSSFKG